MSRHLSSPAEDESPTEPDEAREARELERLAVALAVAAARLIHEQRPARLGSSTKSSDTDVVTEMDTRSESFLRAELARLRPRDGVLGEEGSTAVGSSGVTWVLDPIDGTTNYLYELPPYAVSVAAAVGSPPAAGWRPIAGAVCAPALGVVWSAAAGAGARRSVVSGSYEVGPAQAVHCGAEQDLARALVATGFGYLAPVRAAQAQVLARVLPAVRDIRRLGSAAIDLCLVADGRVDGYYETGLHPWDLAAGWLVASEAGALVTGADPADPDAAGVADPGAELTVAANPTLAPRLRALVAH